MKATRTATTAGVGVRQVDLFAQGRPELNTAASLERVTLDGASWIDFSSRWLLGGDELLGQLVKGLRWSRAERRMYDRIVQEPRLGALVRIGARNAPVALEEIASALAKRYAVPFTSAWLNYYRNGGDSVAWHGDRIGLNPADAIVAIVSLGGPRRLLLRPRGGGASRCFTLASGDLLVMGGACQQSWEHSIPKAADAPPRISITLRHSSRASQQAAERAGS